MQGRLLIFCGIPGSGKTTVAKIVAETAKDSILIQTDNVRGMLAHPNFSGAESAFIYDACFAIAKEALRKGYLVLLDGTFIREEYRSAARAELRRYYRKVDTVWVSCGLETALRRNSRREARVPPQKVERMLQRFVPPRRAIRVDTSRLSADAAARKIVRELSL